MKIIGFNFTKNDFRFCVLDGTKNPPTIIEKNKIVYPNNMDTADLMEWFETQLSLIIDKHQPNQISHKISSELDDIRPNKDILLSTSNFEFTCKKEKHFNKQLLCTGYQCD
jgi:hypothetical protein